ncbi:MAG: hypothetical protein L7U45_01915 [Alphaproteobacteria bacterium]|nr:hypothetical protein [Alphaproteobacteria bacterium]
MKILPPPTNDQYQGAVWAVIPLALVALQTLIGGTLHVLLPDSGLISIAGLDLAHDGGLQMIAMAARLGATQMVWGLVLALIVLRHRNFTLLFLCLAIVEKGLLLLGRAIKPTGAEHMPLGFYGAMILLVLCVIAIYGARAKSE